MAQEWHRRIYAGVRLPVSYYAGKIRDSDSKFPSCMAMRSESASNGYSASLQEPVPLSLFAVPFAPEACQA
jgi:hypothetical protein